MKDRLTQALILLVGLINVIPVIGALSASMIQSLYHIDISDPNLVILMRHRAILFGILGGYILFSLIRRDEQKRALFVGLISMVSFAGIALMEASLNAKLSMVLTIDYVGIGAAAVALLLLRSKPQTAPS
ncbi:hypothetical protein QGN29_09805 [Temperatibacter marinus]|uniref:Phosphopantetheine adenylyltransferase n=1 Tax=Temperatibacter marinus TaxID=1456591 RepID=A0AA52EGE5_9PROT|nr:hypothetical protein [Temperatibacter marinus]WND01844.1 hypothetical protein QGN29_09805 [Temperatibacter marinus]